MSGHVVPARLYYGICAVLLVLTWLTVWVAFRDLGQWNMLVALGIAMTKATLVILYFMHARWSPRFILVIVVSGVLFIGILLALTLADYMTRGWAIALAV